MWNKISEQKDVEKLGVGSILIKYPVDGNSVEKLNLSDTQNLLRYEIYAINDGVADLRIPEQDIPNPSYVIGLGKITGTIKDVPEGIQNVTGITDNPPLLHKKIDQLIPDGNWWFES